MDFVRDSKRLMSYLRVERAEVRSKAIIDSFLKQREKLKKFQMEFTVARFGLSALGWYEPFQSSVNFVMLNSWWWISNVG